MTTHNNRPLTKRIEERSEELTPLGRQMVDYLMRNPNDLLRLAKLVRLQDRDLIVIADSRNCPCSSLQTITCPSHANTSLLSEAPELYPAWRTGMNLLRRNWRSSLQD